MKKLLFLLLILNSISASTQTIGEIIDDFWDAVDTRNNPIIVKKGEQLIVYIVQFSKLGVSLLMDIQIWVIILDR